MAKGPMTPEAKAKLMERLKAGKAHHSAMRSKDPKHKPRKARKSKKDDSLALQNPLADTPDRSKMPGIDAPPAGAKNVVADLPVDPSKNESSKIDVPNLPEESKLKKIVKQAELPPVPTEGKGLSTTGKPARYNDNDELSNQETGMMAIETMLPGQKESIKKLMRKNKKLDPLAPSPAPAPAEKTVDNVVHHVATKAIEGRAPFSMSNLRKLLYQ